MGNSITLWRNSDFVKLWIGQTVSELGSRITREGLPLAAVMVLHVSPWQMGVLSGLNGIAVLVFGLSAGVWGDRLRRRPILITTDLGRAAFLSAIPIAAAFHVLAMWQLYAVATLTGILTVFFDVAYQSYLPSLVKPDQILEGNSQLMLSATTAEILGPGLTGVLVQLITAPLAILFDAVSFLFAASTVASIRQREPARAVPERGESIWTETLAGIHFIAGHPILRPLALRAVTAYFFFGLLGPLYVLYAIDILKLTPAELGVTISVGGLAGVLGSLVSRRVVRAVGLGRTFIFAALMHSLAALLIPLAGGPVPVAIAILMLGQLVGDSAFAIYGINEITVRQRLADAGVLSRVNAAMQLATRGILPLGAFAGGFLAAAIGVRAVLAIAAAGVLASVAWLVNRRMMSMNDVSSMPEHRVSQTAQD